MISTKLPHDLAQCVQQALDEDLLGDGARQYSDINADLIPAEKTDHARIVCRETAVIAGTAYAEEAFRQIDDRCELVWHVHDGERVEADTVLCDVKGPSRALLTAERAALNFLQTLSGTATTTAQYVAAVEGTSAKLLDTRKTLPGLRNAQKYAVLCGGGHNHRIGLYDAFLIKENHIAASGSISAAIERARQAHPNTLLEIEVENHEELMEAIDAQPDRIMLDNFSLGDLRSAVEEKPEGIDYEASGGITLDNLRAVAETGVDYISLGVLTKDLHSIDLSMRVVDEKPLP
ncbi:nicotinate-nucleotide pyrophosphorylase [gamma proteobacterium HTCC5015]|nr:nicotinate-nucleotide pyrophosphorylase [gamma proteobacterium HTCC5015]